MVVSPREVRKEARDVREIEIEQERKRVEMRKMFLFMRDSFETGAMYTTSSILQVPKLRNLGQDQ